MIEFKFIKKKSFNLIFYSQRNNFGLHFIKKKKTRFHNYNETSILFLEKWFLQGKGDLFILITGTNFQFIKKTKFYNFYLRKIFPNQIYSKREIFITFIFFRFLLKELSIFFIKSKFGTLLKLFWNSLLKQNLGTLTKQTFGKFYQTQT